MILNVSNWLGEIMNRQQALNETWKRLLIIFIVIGTLSIGMVYFGGNARVPVLVFMFGNLGSYIGVHRSIAKLSDAELAEFAGSWFCLITPSLAGGVLAFVLYVLFLSGILNEVSGLLFPVFEVDTRIGQENIEDFGKIWNQHAVDFKNYAKLFFWSFVAGFNQKYAVDIIESVKSKI